MIWPLPAWPEAPVVVSNTSPLALALERQATLLLLDETEGRRVAASYGLVKTGVLGILLQAKKQGIISSLRAEMEKRQHEAHFWISPPLFEKLLRSVAE